MNVQVIQGGFFFSSLEAVKELSLFNYGLRLSFEIYFSPQHVVKHVSHKDQASLFQLSDLTAGRFTTSLSLALSFLYLLTCQEIDTQMYRVHFSSLDCKHLSSTRRFPLRRSVKRPGGATRK